MNKNLFLFFKIFSVFIFNSCQSSSNNEEDFKREIILHVKNNSNASGVLFISELQNGGINIQGKIINLPPKSVHGFHFHEKGDCSGNDAMNAGGHFNPDKTHVHGTSITNHDYIQQHAGDLGNIVANESGIANIDLTIKSPKFSLHDGRKYSLSGKSIIIHAEFDDEKTNPAGNAGKRILCGTI